MWIGTQTTGPAVRGPQPAGGPRDVLREPDQTSGPGELQHPGLRANLDHRGVDPGESPTTGCVLLKCVHFYSELFC